MAKEIKINIFDALKQKLSFSCPHVAAETVSESLHPGRSS